MGIVILLLAAILMGLGIPMAIVGARAISAPVPNEEPLAPVIEVVSEYETDAMEWAMFWHESFEEHASEFDALFNSYTYKVSKNGRSMINGKFVAKGK